MDKSAVKNFAVWARRKLIDDITQKAFELGITEKGISKAVKVSSDAVQVNGRLLQKYEVKQREALVARIKEKGFQEVIEEAAYTWFNRIIAIRFMEVNEYLPTGIRVLSSTEEGKAVPDIVTNAFYVDLGQDLDLVHEYLDNHDDEGLFRYLFIKQCNKLNEILPFLFEKIEDYTEILLPNNLLAEGSVIRRLVSDIKEEDFKEQVEIIGWLYQYYISEKKDQVFEALRKNIKITKENIPAATQLFTPDWIVKYMVENSLGRLWLEGHPVEELKSKWKYYLEEAEQEPEVQKQLAEIREKSKNIRPEDIKVLDPCMGSGHILVYAFDVLFDIYKSAGYSERDIPKLILKNNLYGLDIDDRAAQLAYFAVMMKARSKSRRIFNQIRDENIDLNLCAIQESNGISREALEFFLRGADGRLKADVEYLVKVFHDAKEYGSILEVKPVDFEAVEKRLEEIRDGETGVVNETHQYNIEETQYRNIILEKMPALVKQAKIMSQKYDVVCTNPPYMGNRGMDKKLSNYLKQYYPNTKSDISTVFMEKTLKMCKTTGYMSMINIPVWMFLSTYEKLREKLLRSNTFINMLHFGRGVFGSDFSTTAFVISRQNICNYKAIYRKLYQKQGAVDNIEQKEKWFFEKVGHYEAKKENFFKIPGMPIAYWISNHVINCFIKGKPLDKIAEPKVGLQTGNNDIFLRLWHEVAINRIGFGYLNSEKAAESKLKWFPYNKGGEYRKWYGNNEYIVNWENDGIEIKNFKDKSGKLKSRPQNTPFYFKRSITWSFVSSSYFGVRYSDQGFIFDVSGSSVFPPEKYHLFLTGLLCAKISTMLINVLNPTISFQVGNVASLPVILPDVNTKVKIDSLVKENISISRTDWDSFETSWDFKKPPLLVHKGNSKTIEGAFNNWATFAEKQFNQLKANEEELNRIFIEIYGLQDELTPEVDDEDITIRKADRVRDIKSFISYAVGCMFGRYSIDAEGLIYAGGEWKEEWRDGKVRKIEKDEGGNVISDTWVDATYLPDEDNIIPILDEEYFDDDIVSRFIDFLKVTFGEEKLEENINYIAETLGKKPSETSRQAIRRYFLKEFYKDHVQVYKKRPIYWLFDSGKEDGFKALIYMHRYDEYTVARVRTDYLHPLQRKYESEIKRLDILIESDVSQREKTAVRKKKEKILKQMRECLAYDQVIAHVANQRIKIDLDDGVAVNYAKFQDVEIPQGEGKKPLKADLLAKI
jgi:type II restriction/modification system DNA methylase subunit YeeA